MSNTFNISEEELELIDKYLSEQLAESEIAAFEKRLDEEESWREKVEEVRLMSIGIQEAFLSGQLDEFHKSAGEMVDSDVKQHRAVNISWAKRWAIAASTLLIVGTLSWLLFIKKNGNEQLFADYYQPDPGLPTLMGVSDNYNFDKAMVDYKMGDYKKALATWKSLLKGNEENDTLNYFIASAYLADKDVKESVVYFDKVINYNNSVFLQDAQWYKALALLDQGRKKEALQLIEKTEHPDKEQLLRKLNE